MVIQKLSDASLLDGESLRAQSGDLSLMVADRRVEEASRRVAEQIRVVAETEAAGEPSEEAARLLQEMEHELKLATERRDAARLQAPEPPVEDREAG